MARLREMQDRLVRSERLAAIGELAASVAHELRNPLSVIRASAYYVKYRLTGETDKSVQDSLDQIEKQVLISDKIIRDLLDFARTRPPQLRPGDVNEVMQATLAGVSFPEEIVVVTQLAEGLPLVPLDPHQMERAPGRVVRTLPFMRFTRSTAWRGRFALRRCTNQTRCPSRRGCGPGRCCFSAHTG